MICLKYRDDEYTIKKLIEHNSKNYLYKFIGDLYRKRSNLKEKKYQGKKAEYRLLALKNYKSYIKNGGKLDRARKLFVKNRGLFRAKNKWSEKFKIDSVPTNKYKVIYFNSNKPKIIVEESEVDYPAVNYERDKFPNHKLSSNDFAALWVGDILFDKDVEKILNFKVSWSEYRLIIDGFEVSKGKKSGAEVPYLFTKGKHRIEVEYLNNYGTTDFMMTMYDKREYIDTKEIKSKLSDDFIFLYVGLYETDNFDNSLKIALNKKYKKPIVLFLGSYNSIYWKINPNENNIKAIFVSSNLNDSVITLQNNKQADIYYLKDLSGATSLVVKCKCRYLYAYCNRESFIDFNKKVLNIFGKKLDGYTTLYPRERVKNITLEVPKISLDDKMRKKLALEEREANRIKYECEKEKNLGIDDIF